MSSRRARIRAVRCEVPVQDILDLLRLEADCASDPLCGIPSRVVHRVSSFVARFDFRFFNREKKKYRRTRVKFAVRQRPLCARERFHTASVGSRLVPDHLPKRQPRLPRNEITGRMGLLLCWRSARYKGSVSPLRRNPTLISRQPPIPLPATRVSPNFPRNLRLLFLRRCRTIGIE